MLKLFGAYLWKEWRDQRAGIAALAAIIVMLAGLAATVASRDLLLEGGDWITSRFTLGALATALVLFAPDIAACDLRRGTHGLAFRAPGGVRAAFWSKIALLVALLAAFTALAYLAIRAAQAVREPMPWVAISAPWHAATGIVLLHALAAGFWIFAAACWLPRGWFGVPGAVLFVALALAPCFWLLRGKTGLIGYLPLGWIQFAHPPLALAVAWASFVRGRRAGGTAWSSAWRGISVAGCAFIPLWAFVGYWAHEWWTPRPEKRVLIRSAYLGADGRYAFLNTQRAEQWPWIGLAIELETGAWRMVGSPGEAFLELGTLDGHTPFAFGLHELIHQTEDLGEVAYVDGTTGAVLGRGPRGLPYVDLIERGRAAKRASSPIRLPDDRRVWLFRHRLEADDGRGGFVKLPWDGRDVVHSVAGYGLRMMRGERSGHSVYDLTRQRRFDDLKWPFCWVLPDRWLISEGVSRTGPSLHWRLLDPETGVETLAPGMRDGDMVLAVLDDGRVLVSPILGGKVFAVRPAVAERTLLDVDAFDLALTKRSFVHDEGNWAPARAPGGRRLFRLYDGLSRLVTTLAPGSSTFTRPLRVHSVLGCLDDRTAIVIAEGGDRLERLDLITGERTTLFPRP